MFLGCGFETENGNLFIVLEFCDKGALNDLLWKRRDSGPKSQILDPDSEIVDWNVRMQILCDVAEGMSFLHLIHKSIHRDLKSPNILLVERKSRIRAKVADFGLTKILDRDSSRNGVEIKKRSFASTIVNLVSSSSPRSKSPRTSMKREDEEEEKKEEKMSLGSKNSKSFELTGEIGTPQWMVRNLYCSY